MMIFNAVFGVILGVGLFTLFYIVPPKTSVTVTRLGKFNKVSGPGLHMKLPFFIDMVDKKIRTNIHSFNYPVRVRTVDHAYVDMPVTALLCADESNIEAAAYNLETPEKDINEIISQEVRATANGMSMDELFSDRDTIEQSVQRHVAAFAQENGYLLKRIVVDAPDPDEEIQRASNEVLASKRLEEAAKNKAAAIKIERIGEAEADAEALKARAGAFAQSRETIAKGMSDAANVLRESGAVDISDREIIRVLEGVDHRDMLISCSKSGSTIIVDAKQDAGSVTAMVEALARDKS